LLGPMILISSVTALTGTADEEEIERRSSACSQEPLCLVLPVVDELAQPVKPVVVVVVCIPVHVAAAQVEFESKV